ncbi:MAG: hypothetical protein ABWZ98_16950 [Nakamurella sp.]
MVGSTPIAFPVVLQWFSTTAATISPTPTPATAIAAAATPIAAPATTVAAPIGAEESAATVRGTP